MANPLGSLFSRSPIQPMQEHMAKACGCAEGLVPFLDALLAQDWETARQAQQAVIALESDADDLKKQIRVHLPKSIFMPVPRSDLLDLLTVQESLANRARDIAGLMIGRKMEIPETMHDAMREFLQASVDTARQALTAIRELDELLESAFRGREVSLIEALLVELDSLEQRTDRLEIGVRQSLFELEKLLPPVDVIFLYRIIDWVGDLADRSQKIGSRLQVLLAR